MKWIFLVLVLISSCFAGVQAQSTPSTQPAPSYPSSQTNAFAQLGPTEWLESARRQLDSAQARYEDAVRRVISMRKELRQQTGRVDVSQSGLEVYATSLDRQLQALSLEQAGSDARMKAIEETVAHQTKRIGDVSKDDPVTTELEKVAAARAERLALVMQQHKAGVSTSTDVQDAIAALAEIRAKIAERRQTVFNANGGDTLAALNKELMNLTIADQERRAKIAYLQKQLAKVEPTLSSTLELETQERMLMQAVSNLQGAQQALNSVESTVADSRAMEQSAAPQTQPAKGQAKPSR